MTRIHVIENDARVALARLAADGELFDGCCTDPPYHLESVAKRFGGDQAAAGHGTDGRFARQSRGFMGQAWDGADADGVKIAFDPEFWSLVLAVLKPGAFCWAFSGSRTGHRQACAMEDAGFIMHPFHGWAYGQGAPHPHPAADAGPEWAGWYVSAGVFKPSLEPVYLGQRKPSERTLVDNLRRWGVGGFHIDANRVKADAGYLAGKGNAKRAPMARNTYKAARDGDLKATRSDPDERGRWPGNLEHDGSAAVEAAFPDDEHGSAARFYHAFPGDVPAVDYCPKPGQAEKDHPGGKHPTVKPERLFAYYIGLVMPPGGRVLDPFAGSGTTGAAAKRIGRREAVLIESHPDYARNLRRRFGVFKDPTMERLFGCASFTSSP